MSGLSFPSTSALYYIRVVYGDPRRNCHGFGICRLDSEAWQPADRTVCGCTHGQARLLRLSSPDQVELRITSHDFYRFIQPETATAAPTPTQRKYPVSRALSGLVGLNTPFLYPCSGYWEFVATAYAFITLTSNTPFPDE